MGLSDFADQYLKDQQPVSQSSAPTGGSLSGFADQYLQQSQPNIGVSTTGSPAFTPQGVETGGGLSGFADQFLNAWNNYQPAQMDTNRQPENIFTKGLDYLMRPLYSIEKAADVGLSQMPMTPAKLMNPNFNSGNAALATINPALAVEKALQDHEWDTGKALDSLNPFRLPNLKELGQLALEGNLVTGPFYAGYNIMTKDKAPTVLVDAIKGAEQELLDPRERLGGADLIAHQNPDFASEHPVDTAILGMVTDVKADPLNLIHWGSPSIVPRAIMNPGTPEQTTVEVSKLGAEFIAQKLKESQNIKGDGFSIIRDTTLPDPMARLEEAYKSFSDMVNAGRKDFLSNKGVQVGPFNVIPKSFFTDTLSMNDLGDALGRTKVWLAARRIASKFNRSLGAPEWVESQYQQLMTKKQAIEADSIREGQRLVEGIGEEGSRKVGKAVEDIQKALYGVQIKYGNSVVQELNKINQGEVDSKGVNAILSNLYSARKEASKASYKIITQPRAMDDVDLAILRAHDQNIAVQKEWEESVKYLKDNLKQRSQLVKDVATRVDPHDQIYLENLNELISKTKQSDFPSKSDLQNMKVGFERYLRTKQVPTEADMRELQRLDRLIDMRTGLEKDMQASNFKSSKQLMKQRQGYVNRIAAMKETKLVPTNPDVGVISPPQKPLKVEQLFTTFKGALPPIDLEKAKLDESTKAIQDIVQGSNFTPKEMSLFSSFMRMRQSQEEMLKTEGLLSHQAMHMSKPYFEAISEPQRLFAWMKEEINRLQNPAAAMKEDMINPDIKILKMMSNAAMPKDTPEYYRLLDAGVKQGLKPELDAGVLYTHQLIDAQQAVEDKRFRTLLKNQFADGKGKVPEFVDRYIRLVDNPNYYNWMQNKYVFPFVKAFDWAQNVFRKSASISQLDFGVRQALGSNPLQAYQILGAKSLGMWDPSIQMMTIAKMHYGSNVFREGTEIGEELLKQKIKTPFGSNYSFADFANLVDRYNVYNDLANDIQWEKSIKRSLNGQQFLGMKIPDELKGFSKAMSLVNDYMKFPSYVENYYRISTFGNALSMGHHPEEAARLVDQIYFPYARGLSEFEKKFMRRMFTFYSYPRFAIPMFAKTLLKSPGNVANTGLVINDFFKAWNKLSGDQQLSPEERFVIQRQRGYVLEQAGTYAGKDDQKQAVFNTFNNYTPLDTFMTIETNKDGSINYQRTMEKMVLSAMSNNFKMGFEHLLAHKNFFTNKEYQNDNDEFLTTQTGKTITPKGERIPNITPQQWLANAAATIAAAAGKGGLVAILGGKYGIQNMPMPDNVQDWLKDRLGWEEIQNPYTKKKEVYINPHTAFVSNEVFPMMRYLIKSDDQDLTPRERAYQLLFGVNSIHVDLKQAEASFYYDQKKALKIIQKDLRSAMMNKEPDRVQELTAIRDQLLELIKQKQALKGEQQ